jgi:hypothetical protein
MITARTLIIPVEKLVISHNWVNGVYIFFSLYQFMRIFRSCQRNCHFFVIVTATFNLFNKKIREDSSVYIFFFKEIWYLDSQQAQYFCWIWDRPIWPICDFHGL